MVLCVRSVVIIHVVNSAFLIPEGSTLKSHYPASLPCCEPLELYPALVCFRMLDEFGNELENTDSKLDTTMKKVAKVLHMSNGE